MTARNKWFWLVFPALFVVIAFYCGGLFLIGFESFASSYGDGKFLFANYFAVLSDREVSGAFIFTLYLTFVSTILSAICGTILAVLLRDKIKQRAFLRLMTQIPLAVPHLAIAVILLNTLSSSGIFARLFYVIGLIETPSDFFVLVGDVYGIGIIFAYVIKETPFIALIVLTVFARIGDDYEQVAFTLGASRWQKFRYVTLPIIAPPIFFSSLIVFVFVFGAFEIPYILGRSYPNVLTVAIQRKFNGADLNERPEALALSILMTIAASILALIYLKFTKAFLKFEKDSIF